ncbi:hypothetical protein SAMN05421505_11283 [Sinosporangium album]|uniref:DUF7296 domain-containing protein n=1 Tax=Sinosporangium album TaxID=504805 RepID=A0A1G8AAX6_9ACTN|nr:hypothetical protein [Sinosporangium album]SDH18041.1 hypothetical protein SAMN05421505_11283 [Sinosporangium album]
MAFFTFHQNPSWAKLDIDPSSGIGPYIIIEAENANEANALAVDSGLYFDGSGDCPCCGNRWTPLWGDEKGSHAPEIDGEGVTEVPETTNSDGYVHYMDGRITAFVVGESMQAIAT